MVSNNCLPPNNGLKRSFVFITNNINVEGELPIEVAPGHFFQKADDEQIKMIKESLLSFMEHFSPVIPWEGKVIKIQRKQTESFIYGFEPLPKDQWKYWVITFEGSTSELQEIAWASSLLKNDLELGFESLALERNDWSVSICHYKSLFSFFADPAFREPAITIICDEIRQISDNYTLIKKNGREHIRRSLIKFCELKSLPRNSELIIIVLFSIIESLITHCPSNKNIDDSINHQIHTKIPLLSKRFPRKLDCTKYFGKTNEEDTWKKLYKYRNSIVHGEHPSLAGSLKKVLKDRDTVYVFLKETVKLLLLLALKEPIFLTDLKKC